MKKDKRTVYIASAAAVVLVFLGIWVGIHFWHVHRRETLLQEQNYVASRLLELGEYEQGRILAAQSEQMKENAVSEQLLVLAAGFQADYEVGLLYAEKYLAEREDDVIASAKAVCQESQEVLEGLSKADQNQYTEAYYAQKDKAYRELLPLLLQVQNSISVKKTSESMLAIVDVLAGTGGGYDVLEQLESSNSLLSQKAQVSYAVQTGDYSQALEKAEKLYNENATLENRSLLANLVVEQGEAYGEDTWADTLREQQGGLREEYRVLETQYAGESSITKQSKIEQKMEDIQAQIDGIEEQIRAIPALKAISFMEASTPSAERDTVAYKMELAQLYYRADQQDKARELLVGMVRADKADKADKSPAVFLLSDFLQKYMEENSAAENMTYGNTEQIDLKILWDRIAKLLCFVERRNGYGEEDFRDFVMNLLDELYNGITIRSIDATAFPTVRLTVNVSLEMENTLEKKDFSFVEMGKALEDFRILNMEDLEQDGELAVALVVDRSGSMDGTPMEDTRSAVTNFVKSLDGLIEVGLVAFDNSAQVITPVGNNRNGVLQGIASLNAEGGTNIYSGLKLAGQELDAKAGRKVIILLSDGEDGNTAIIDEVLDELKRKEIYVYTIGFGGADTEYLGYIARKCGGKFIQAYSSQLLGEIYSTIGNYMVNDYVIEFEAVMDPEEFTRTIRVSVKMSDAFAEKEYHVGVSPEAIEAEQNRKPLADYFQQVGGSWMETEE